MDKEEVDRQLKLARGYLDSEIIMMSGGTRKLIMNLVFIIDTLSKEKGKRWTVRPPAKK